MDREPVDWSGCLALMWVFTLWIPLAAWSGFVITVLWGWFIQPFGIGDISIWHAVGLGLFPSYYLMNVARNATVKNPGMTMSTALGTWAFESLLGGALILLFGWVAHSFM